MAIPAIGQSVLLLLSCIELTLASSDQRAADDQIRSDDIYGDMYTSEDPESLNNMMGEDSYVYIDDDGHGARFQYGGHGAETDLKNHQRDDTVDETLLQDCRLVKSGSHSLAGDDQACDIEIKGADENREGNIPWGIDGVYNLAGCFEGFPVYMREGKTRLQRRFLWFSNVFHDWDVGLGDFHKDQMNRPPLMYGASSPIQRRPELLGADAWLVMNVYHPAQADVSYSPMKLSVACAQASSTEAGAQPATEALMVQRDEASVLRSSERRPAQ